MKSKSTKRIYWHLVASAVGMVAGIAAFHAPLCQRPSMLLDNAESQVCDIRESAAVGAKGFGYPADARRTGLDLRLAGVRDYQILFLSGQHQSEETARRAAGMLGADGGYLDTHGNYVGAAGQWTIAAASLDDGPAREADPGTVALLVKRP